MRQAFKDIICVDNGWESCFTAHKISILVNALSGHWELFSDKHFGVLLNSAASPNNAANNPPV